MDFRYDILLKMYAGIMLLLSLYNTGNKWAILFTITVTYNMSLVLKKASEGKCNEILLTYWFRISEMVFYIVYQMLSLFYLKIKLIFKLLSRVILNLGKNFFTCFKIFFIANLSKTLNIKFKTLSSLYLS